MSDQLEQRIVTAIADMDDPKFKIVLMLLLNVLKELGEQIRSGHDADHADHHLWIAAKIEEEKAAEADEKQNDRKFWAQVRIAVATSIISIAATVAAMWLATRV